MQVGAQVEAVLLDATDTFTLPQWKLSEVE
jgi:hypothetical protein